MERRKGILIIESLSFMEKKINLGLLPKLIVAIVLGIVIGLTLGDVWDANIIRLTNTLKEIFSNFLTFIIPLIIIGFIVPGIAELGAGAGKTLAITAVIAYVSTVIAGVFAYFVDSVAFHILLNGSILPAVEDGKVAEPFFSIDMPPIMAVMSALLLAFVLGLGIATTGSTALKECFSELQEIVTKVIHRVIIPILPVYVFSIFANMAYEGTVFVILKVFIKVFLLILVLHWVIICIQYSIAGIVAKKNPFLCIKTMLPAYMTAIGTQSSAATIPITLAQTKQNGVRGSVADFVIPLCATIHLSGSTITLTSCSLAIMMLKQDLFPDHGFTVMFPFILMLGVTMIAAPGVPGGAIMAGLGLLMTMLNFTDVETGLMIALYMAQDSFGTACNVTGDGAIAILVDAVLGRKKKGNG